MIANIYDVAHGFTAYVRDEKTGFNVLLDCGYNEETLFYPTDEIRSTYGSIERFYVLNYDEDHLDGLPRLRLQVGDEPFRALGRNRLTTEQILSMKTRPYGVGISELVKMIPLYERGENLPLPSAPPGEVTVSKFWNSYPSFKDTNNLSMVVFIHGISVSMVFPGDLETAGWTELLKSASFRSELARVRVFVASHHGRTTGYCEEVFNYCSPDVIIISDEPKQYDTQEDSYAKHAKGIVWNGGPERRYVLTTRKDGHLRLSTPQGCAFHIAAGS